ncbi:hypothetical protein [Clostridium perfringens]|uniref:hypothetical protein n=1 Tax=Clostridium perfringens TaxID=1502 RepID=UPI0013E2D799|nr:hypothetical protein [Clostridium perfringens]MDK0767036.1 hypothetical protein [Clostridium perfringens]MDU8975572.1 hypothetical protein [Clostridium perfringens]NGU48060.1 hypothetical protein [Clostridium perfringens]
MGKAIHEKDLRLLKICNVTKDYPILIDVIENHPDIHLEDLKELSDEHVRFFDNMYSTVRIQAFREWTGSIKEDIKIYKESDNKVCYICNHTLKFACTIHNKITGEKIDIGRDCNKHFGIYEEKDIEDILRQQQKLVKRDKLDKKFPGLMNIIKNWRNIDINEELYIFYSIKERYLYIGEKIAELNKEYLEKNITITREDEILKDIEVLLIESKIEKEKINKFIKENKGSMLFPTKKMVDSLKANGDDTGVEELEKNGIITVETLHRFRDEEFCKRLIVPLNNELSKLNIKISSFKRHNRDLGYYLILERKEDCKLFCKYEDLCVLYGNKLTDNDNNLSEEVTENDIIKESELIDEYSIEYGLQMIGNIVYDKGIELEEYFHSYEDVIWKVKKKDSKKVEYYLLTKIKSIKNILKEVLFISKKYDSNILIRYLKNSSKKLYNGDARDLIRMRNK